MTPTEAVQATQLSKDLLQAFDNVFGVHPGFRPAHAKGTLVTGVFTPSSEGSSFTRAAHIQRTSTPVTVRFSDFAGIPTVADNDPENASPRGCAIRFHLAEHVHTDIVSQSYDGFPTRTAEEFLEFLRALAASDPSKPHPNAIESFLGAHPKALQFVQGPKPIPTSFAKETFHSVSAFKFTNARGVSRYGRYRIQPESGNEYLDAAGAAAKGPNFLFDELSERIARGPIKFHIVVKIAEDGDIVDDSTVHWPEDRPQLTLGEMVLNAKVQDDAGEQRQIIFDPIPRVDGIETSGDPLFEPRADLYLLAGRRRRAASKS